jgi:hypothetical protein
MHGPMAFRSGGHSSYRLTLEIASKQLKDKAYCMTIPRWNELLHFGSSTGLSIAFGVNVMYGRNCTTRCAQQPCGAGNTGYGTCDAWDPSNAVALMEYTAAHNLSIGGFEVGNEKEHVLTPTDYAGCMHGARL